jgi:hypothetical protein
MVFDWDTTTGDRASVVERLVAIGDPVGEETAGLVSDLGGYLPDQATWATLRDMDTRQWVTIDTLAVPTSWGQAVAEATDGELRPGVTAYTITGTRHREGVWRSEPASFSAPVAFTMFLTCPPGTGECHLLRLSALGKTLD